MFRFEKSMFAAIDWFLLALVIVLSAGGVLAIANATASPYAATEEGIFGVLERINPTYPRLQAIWFGIGFVLMAVVVAFDYHLAGELWTYVYLGCCAFLLLVLLIGGEVSGVKGWFRFDIGESVRQLQPAEFVKIGLIVTFARLMARNNEPITRIRDLLLLLAVLAVPVGLLVVAEEYGSAMVYIAIFIGMLVTSGTSWKLLFGLFTSAVLSLLPIWSVLSDFRKQRVLAWFDPDLVSESATYQVDHAKLAIGAGQMEGRGFFQEGLISQLGYLPAKHTDFIFAVTAESVGFMGCVTIVGLFLLMIFRMFMLASRAGDRFGALIIVGVASMFAFHAFLNIGMNVGILPVAGIPLPFLSYGGSSMLTNMIAVGLVINVSMRSVRRRRADS